MNTALILSVAATVVFLLVRLAQTRVDESSTSLKPKQLVSDACIVFLSVFAGEFIVSQLGQVDALAGMFNLPIAGGGQAKAFTDQPKF